MKSWENEAIRLLDKSLTSVPQELNELDWKLDISGKDKKLSQHLSAFANYPGGGTLVYGIDKTGKIIGVNQINVSGIIEKLTNKARDGLDPVVHIEHCITAYKESDILFIYVKESSIKPVHLKGKTIENSYIRSGGTTRLASRHEIRTLILNSKMLRYEELHASKLLKAVDVLDSLDYRAIHNLLERPVPQNIDEILNWMEKEKMVKKMEGSGYYITNFGAIAAARNLNSFDDLTRKTIRLIKYRGLNKNETEREYTGRLGYAIGFRNLIAFINASLPQSEIIKDALRYKTTVYPEIALRELIANALIHQDFAIRGSGPMIEIFDDSISITSPGRLLPSKKIDRLIGTNPESRNEILASSFRRYKICEERGTGFEKAIISIEIFGLPPLYFEEGENYFRVVMFSPKSFAEMSVDERIQACYQHAIIKHLSNSVMTNASLRERFKMKVEQRSMISRLIKDSCDRGLITAKEPGSKSYKNAEYVPIWA